MRPCETCKNKKIGCSKFCTKYKNEYDLCIESIKLQQRVHQREEEIIRRIRERKS